MTHVWSLICERCESDPQGRKSLINVLTELHLPAVPEALPSVEEARFELVSLYRRSDPAVPETTDARLVVLAPGRAEISKTALQVNLSAATSVMLHLVFRTLRVTELGVYFFQVQHVESDTWVLDAEVPLIVLALGTKGADGSPIPAN